MGSSIFLPDLSDKLSAIYDQLDVAMMAAGNKDYCSQPAMEHTLFLIKNQIEEVRDQLDKITKVAVEK